MLTGKRAVVIALVLAAGLLSGSQAQAQNWLGRSFVGWRANAWWRSQGIEGLFGGEIVGTSSFASGAPTVTYTAAQWQALVSAQARQTPTMTAAQWQQLVTARAGQLQLPQPSPAQVLNAQRAAALLQQQQMQNARFAELLRQLQQQTAPPAPH